MHLPFQMLLTIVALPALSTADGCSVDGRYVPLITNEALQREFGDSITISEDGTYTIVAPRRMNITVTFLVDGGEAIHFRIIVKEWKST